MTTRDPVEQHREALARLNGLLEDEFLITAYEPHLRGCRDILLRHAPVECVDVVPESHWCAGCAVRWPCPDWRDAAGTEAQGAEEVCCDMHNQHCEPPGDLCCHACTEAAHDTFPIRHADGSRCVLETS